MSNCSNLIFLSTIACKLSDCIEEKELAVLAAELVALGDLIEAELARKEACQNTCKTPAADNLLTDIEPIPPQNT